MKKLYAILAFLFLFTDLQVCAQEKTFPADSTAFLEKMEEFLSDVRKKEGQKLIEEEFQPIWYSGNVSDHERKRVYRMANFMAEKNLRAYPHFKNFLLSFVGFKESDRSKESFDLWMGSLQKILMGREKRKFNDYLKTTKALFSRNILYKSLSTTWKAESDNYTIKFEDDRPVLEFGEITLKCYAKGDSSVIHNTKGRYLPTENEWHGHGGKVTWKRAGFDENNTYAVLKDYEVEMRSPRFEADSVLFYNNYFDKPLKGELKDRVLSGVTKENAIYPKFESYNQRLSIPDIDKDIDYNGGFTVSGSKLLGSGTKENPAKVTVRWKNSRFLRMESLNFTITPEQISAQEVEVNFNLKDDSITHPQLKLRLDRKERLLTLIRTDKGRSKSPYFNTYHELEMYFEALYWNIDDPLMKFSNLQGSTDQKAAFESTDYFKPKRYRSLSTMGDRNPLLQIRGLSRKLDNNTFGVKRLAKHVKLPNREVKEMAIRFSNMGFVQYDDRTGTVTIRQKLFDYIKNSSGKKDYDHILFNSETKEGNKNAKLSLLDTQLTIYGLKRVDLSKTQKVALFPDKGKVTVQENRDMEFSGGLVAGKMEIFGKNFDFDYKKFEMDMPEIDSALIWTPRLGAMKAEKKGEKKEESPKDRELVRSVIENMKGTLRIDAPNNKSGMKKAVYPRYPILKSKKASYVYYDDPSIHKGVYSRDDFYFKLEPFKMDSLDNFPNEAIAFQGTFSSGEIFPDFEEKLTLMKDHSLGFSRKAPKGGFPMYGEDITFDNKIRLSNEGLKGNGKIDFVTSTSRSTQFNLFPDSTTGIAEEFRNEKKEKEPDVPKASGKDIFIKYVPGDEKLLARKEEKPLALYNDEADLHGGVVLSKQKMRGDGTMEFSDAELSSENFHFKHMVTNADTASFNLKDKDASKFAFKTDNVNAHVDFENRKAEFKANGENTFIDFPENQYICYMDKFNWRMDQKDVELEASQEMQEDININTELDLSKSNFYSVHPEQDSLSFMSPRATYSIEKKQITAHEVPYIPVADARIAPDSGIVRIEEDAEMQTLKNAEILANTVTKYHRIHNAQASIFAKKDYSASGDYHYIDKNKTKQTIHFNNITVDQSGETYATGKVLKNDGFTLSPEFSYHGDVRLEASVEQLEFNGDARINHECDTIPKNWFSFKSRLDPNDIAIPFQKDRNSKLSAGMVLTSKRNEMYTTFLNKKRNEKDHALMKGEGRVTFNEKDQTFRIGTEEKLKNQDMPGNYMSLRKRNCQLKGNGEIDLGAELGIIEIDNFGTFTDQPLKSEYAFNTTMTVDFFIKDDLLEIMAEDIKEYPNLSSFDFSKSVYENALREIAGVDQTDEIISQLSLKGEIEDFPEELGKPLVLSDVDFVWDESTSSYRSKGRIGISNILEEQVFKYVEGHIVVSKHRSADKLSIYLELDKNNWYFFQYRKGVMQAISSNEEFNNEISETKEKDRKYDGDDDEASYRYTLSSERKKIRFLKEFK